MTTLLAWLAVSFIQLYAIGCAVTAGKRHAQNIGGSGYALAALVIGAAAILSAWALGGAA